MTSKLNDRQEGHSWVPNISEHIQHDQWMAAYISLRLVSALKASGRVPVILGSLSSHLHDSRRGCLFAHTAVAYRMSCMCTVS
jgi:hypothetical protein